MQQVQKDRILIAAGGICSDPYIEDAVYGSKFNHSVYNKIIFIDYEPFLDKRYGWIPFYRKMRRLDKHGDWWQFAWKEDIRNEIRKHIENIVSQYDPDQVDGLFHSLGTWAILGCDISMSKVMLFGSPYGSDSAVIRFRVKRELKKSIPKGLRCKELIYCFNREDFVSKEEPDIELLKEVSSKIKVLRIGLGHGLTQYLNCYEEK